MTTVEKTKKSSPKVVLVLGGGGAKGIAHIGVLEALDQANIPIDLIIGCSVGALIGALYADGHQPSHILERAIDIAPRRPGYKVFGLPSPISGVTGRGFFKVQNMGKILEKEITSRTFEELKTPLKVVVTDIHQGALVTLDKGALVPSVCASAAMPIVFQPVNIDGKEYVDGGLLVELPLEVVPQVKGRLLIGSNIKGWLDIKEKGEIKNVGLRSYYIMRNYFDQEKEEKADVIIRPDLSGVMNLVFSNEDVIREVHKRGKEEAQKQIPKIKALLKKLADT